MKRIFTFGLMLTAVFALTNCTEELIDQTIPTDEVTQETVTPEGEGIPFQFYATLGTETKTAGDGMKTKWDDNDQITVFYAEVTGGAEEIKSAGNFTIKDKDNGLFDGFLPEGILPNKTYNWYFVYNASKVGNSNTVSYNKSKNKITANIGKAEQTQTGIDNIQHIGTASNCLMLGKALNLSGSIIPRVQMRHSSALVALTVINQGDGSSNGEASINISNLTFSVTKATKADGTTVSSVPIVGAFETDLLGATYTAASGSSNYVTLTQPYNEESQSTPAINIAAGKSATFYIAIRPFDENLMVSELEVGINTTTSTTGIDVHKRKIAITPNPEHFNAGTITKVQVPVKLTHPKTSDALSTTNKIGYEFISWSNKQDEPINVNGESVGAYIVGNGRQGTITITGDIDDLINALPASFYASYWNGSPAAMTVTNINAWIKEGDNYTPIAKYGPLDTKIRSELKGPNDKVIYHGILTGDHDLTDTAVDIVKTFLESGIPREDELLGLCLTKFIAPQTITFRGVVSNNSSPGDDIIILDEEPIHKIVSGDNINALFNQKFKGATFEGLSDIIKGISSAAAVTTSEILYDIIDQQFSKDADGNDRVILIKKEVDLWVVKFQIDADVRFKAILDAFFENAASLRAMLPKLKLSITIGTYPYSANDADYGTKGAPDTPDQPYNPLVFWGLDAYGN